MHFFFPASDIFMLLVKVALDQTLWAFFINFVFFFVFSLLEGNGIRDAFDVSRDKTKDAVRVGWMVWPLVQLINLSIIPIQYRILVINFICIFWNTYLGWKVNQPIKENDNNIEMTSKEEDTCLIQTAETNNPSELDLNQTN